MLQLVRRSSLHTRRGQEEFTPRLGGVALTLKVTEMLLKMGSNHCPADHTWLLWGCWSKAAVPQQNIPLLLLPLLSLSPRKATLMVRTLVGIFSELIFHLRLLETFKLLYSLHLEEEFETGSCYVFQAGLSSLQYTAQASRTLTVILLSASVS